MREAFYRGACPKNAERGWACLSTHKGRKIIMVIGKIHSRIVQYGDIAEEIKFKNPHYVHQSENRYYTKGLSEPKRDDSVTRTRTTLYRLIYCNIRRHGDFPPIFLTLTYAENKTNLTEANKDFRHFIKRICYMAGSKLCYICIPEFQKRGAVHYHIMFFNLPKFSKREISDCWGHGSTRVELPKNIKNLSAYMAKYLSKDILDKRLKGHRILLTSQKLIRPTIYDNDKTSFLNTYDILKQTSAIETDKKRTTTFKIKLKKYATNY
jgi:hypothetical protein